MPKYYLDFEEPIRELDERILELESQTDPTQETLKEIAKTQGKLFQLIEKVYSKLNRWQRVQLARNPNRNN